AVEAVILYNYFQTRLARIAIEMRLLAEEFIELLRERPVGVSSSSSAEPSALASSVETRGEGAAGMAIGTPPHGAEEGAENVFAEINITPLTDIFLVLLIIFMVTSSVIVNQNPSSGAKAGLKVNLPTGSSADVKPAETDLSVAILADGRIVLAGNVVGEEELKKALEETKQRNPNTMVIVQADEGVAHGKVVQVMEMAKGAGLAQLAIGVREGPK